MSAELLAILEKLEKPIAVEERTGCRNFAVIGGFDKYMVAWAKRASELCDSELRQSLDELAKLFVDYMQVDITERRRRLLHAKTLLAQIRQSLNNSFVSSTQTQPTSVPQVSPATEQVAKPAARAVQPDNEQTLQRLSGTIVPQRTEPTKLPASRPTVVSPQPQVPSPRSPAPSLLSLTDPVRYLKGVGPQRAKLLKRLGVETIGDLLHFYPRRYEDRRNLKTLAEVVPGEKVVVQVQVVGNPFTEERKHLLITKVPVGDATGRAFLVWFNQPYMEKKFRIGQRLFVFGKATQVFGQLTFQTPEVEEITGDANLQVGRLVPVYPLTEGLSQNFVRSLVQETVWRTIDRLEETLPETVRQRYNLMPLREALRQIHFPDDDEKLEAARRRIVFDEFLTLQLVLALRKKGIKEHEGIAFQVDWEAVERFIRLLRLS
jgi:ATP-dependent DNA helicase RecG